jgi:hypothetical protein
VAGVSAPYQTKSFSAHGRYAIAQVTYVVQATQLTGDDRAGLLRVLDVSHQRPRLSSSGWLITLGGTSTTSSQVTSRRVSTFYESLLSVHVRRPTAGGRRVVTRAPWPGYGRS